MGNNRKGWFRAGLISGFVYSVISASAQILSVLAFKPEIISFLTDRISSNPTLFQNISATDLFSLSVSLIPMIAVTGGVLLGLVLAFLFSAEYGRLPGKPPYVRGLVFGLFLWIILNVGIGLADFPQFGPYYYLAGLIGGFIASMAYGYTLALLYSYLSAEKS